MDITIGHRKVGDGHPAWVIAEIGINHNGSLPVAYDMVTKAKESGANAVKFQKRTVELVYTKTELDKPRESRWGTTTRQQKEGLEFNAEQYGLINRHCLAESIDWFASCWDVKSVSLINAFDPPCFKIASASLTDRDLIDRTCLTGKPILLSTGMSTLSEIDAAVERIQRHGNALVVMHCTSTYPSKPEHLNLACVQALKDRYGVPVGYSGHEVGLQTTVAAVAMGACIVERHITLDRSMEGSDQSASVEPHGFAQMVRDIRAIEVARGDGIKRVYDDELPVKAKLRKVETLCPS